MKYEKEDIAVLSWFDAVRRRPAMYIGDTSAAGLHWLVRDLLDVPRDPTALSVELIEGTLVLQAASVAPSIAPGAAGRPPFLVEACSRLTMPLDQPPTLSGHERVDISQTPAVFARSNVVPPCLSLANALSKELVVSSHTGGLRWQIAFSRGVVASPISSAPSAAADGLGMAFTPDPIVFGENALRFDLVAHVVRDVSCVRQIPARVRDAASGAVFELDGRTG